MKARSQPTRITNLPSTCAFQRDSIGKTTHYEEYRHNLDRITIHQSNSQPGTAALCGSVQEPQPAGSTGIGPTFQMFSLYSLMARSDENRPMRAVFRMDIRHHCPGSRQARSTCAWHAT